MMLSTVGGCSLNHLTLVLFANIWRLCQVRTCKRSCQEVLGSDLRPAETIGKTSRCFQTNGSNWEAHECLGVDCKGATGSYYSIILPDKTEGRCETANTFVSFPTWTGTVACEARSQVCDADGNVVQGYEELRRQEIKSELEQEHGEYADELLDKYDEGRFEPHTTKEGGLKNMYLVREQTSSCDFTGLSVITFPASNLKHFQDLKSKQLLELLKQECVNLTEQDVKTNVSAVSWGVDWVDGAQDGRYVRNYGGEGVQVYVLDTGVDSGHEELKGRVGPGKDFTSANDDQDVDRHGHGTHCAGSVAGTTVGVAPLATVVSMKVLHDDGFGQMSALIHSLEYVREKWLNQSHRGPAVVSASVALQTRSPTLNTAIRELVEVGVVVVVAAGNDDDITEYYSPASEPVAITVGAIDQDNQPASFSNFGPGIDIWAPGTDILSARPGGGLVTESGTSMAAPHVAGVVALILEANPSWTPERVREELLACALDEPGGIKGSTGKILSTRAESGRAAEAQDFCILAKRSDEQQQTQMLVGIIVSVALGLFVVLSLFWFLIQGRRRAHRKDKLDFPQRSHEQLEGPDWEAFSEAQPSMAKAVRQAQAVLDDKALFDRAGKQIFDTLRKYMTNCPRSGPGSLDRVPAKADVWDFLLQMWIRQTRGKAQISALCRWLEEEPAWQKALQAEPELCRRRAEMPEIMTE